jgi:hypothetical protein
MDCASTAQALILPGDRIGIEIFVRDHMDFRGTYSGNPISKERSLDNTKALVSYCRTVCFVLVIDYKVAYVSLEYTIEFFVKPRMSIINYNPT